MRAIHEFMVWLDEPVVVTRACIISGVALIGALLGSSVLNKLRR